MLCLQTGNKETPLHCAAQYGHGAVVSLLLENGCDAGIRNAREESALDLAAQYGRLETVERLVRTHPELLAPYSSRTSAPFTIFQNTPLHLASRNGHRYEARPDPSSMSSCIGNPAHSWHTALIFLAIPFKNNFVNNSIPVFSQIKIKN